MGQLSQLSIREELVRCRLIETTGEWLHIQIMTRSPSLPLPSLFPTPDHHNLSAGGRLELHDCFQPCPQSFCPQHISQSDSVKIQVRWCQSCSRCSEGFHLIQSECRILVMATNHKYHVQWPLTSVLPYDFLCQLCLAMLACFNFPFPLSEHSFFSYMACSLPPLVLCLNSMFLVKFSPSHLTSIKL